MLEKLFEAGGDGPQEVAEAEVRDDGARHFEEDVRALGLAQAAARVRRGLVPRRCQLFFGHI